MLDIAINIDICNGCGYCALVCPTNCLDLDYETMKSYVTDISQCIVCRNCEEECPKKVIVVKLNE